MFEKFMKSESGDLASTAIGISIFLIVVGYVLAPIGLTAIEGVNTTAAGVASGTNATIWDAFVPIVLVALLLAVVYMVKEKGGV